MLKYIKQINLKKQNLKTNKNNNKDKEVTEATELKYNEMNLNTNLTKYKKEKYLIGALFFGGTVYGMFKGLNQALQYNKIHFPKFSYKLLISHSLNLISENSFYYANKAASLGFVIYMTKKAFDLFFYKQINKLNYVQKNVLIGTSAGMLFKSTRGIGPALLNGFLLGNCTLILSLLSYTYYNHNNFFKVINNSNNSINIKEYVKKIKLLKH